MKLDVSKRSRITATLLFPALMFILALPAPAAEKHSSGQMKALVVNAKTPADHRKVAAHYTAMAVQHEADATEHEALAVEYARLGKAAKTPMTGNTAEHCKYYAEHCRQAAKDLRAMAADHEEMAKAAK